MTSMHRRTVSGTIKALKASVGHYARGGGNVALATAFPSGAQEPLWRDSGDLPRPSGRAGEVRRAGGIAWRMGSPWAAGGSVRGSSDRAPGTAQPLRSSIGQDLLAYVKAFGAYR